MNTGTLPPAGNPTLNSSNAATSAPAVFKPVPVDNSVHQKLPETAVATTQKPPVVVGQTQQPVQQQQPQSPVENPRRPRVMDDKPVMQVPVQPSVENGSIDSANSGGTMDVGSLIAFATKQQAPVYPTAAKSMRTTGVVKVEVTVNETGEVAEVQKASGPMLLQAAAKDAIKKWKFKPFTRDGQPVKATGFINFNFSL